METAADIVLIVALIFLFVPMLNWCMDFWIDALTSKDDQHEQS